MPDLSSWEAILRLAIAALLGGAIGAEREFREREAGFRTHLLVALGSALFTLVSAYGWREFRFSQAEGLVFDPTRIAAQIVTGVGFLGAGAIIRQGLSVRGLTTAATLWAAAAIGLASGAGYYDAAVAATVLVLVGLWPLRIVAHRIFTRVRGADEPVLEVELEAGAATAPLIAAVESAGARLRSFAVRDADGSRTVRLGLELSRGAPESVVLATLSELDVVRGAQWGT